MHLLVLVLNKTNYLEDILHMFHKLGISGATITDSVGVGRTLSDPSRSGFAVMYSIRKIIEGGRPYNKTIFTLVENDVLQDAIDGIKQILGDLTRPGVGLLFTVPIGTVEGLPKREVE